MKEVEEREKARREEEIKRRKEHIQDKENLEEKKKDLEKKELEIKGQMIKDVQTTNERYGREIEYLKEEMSSMRKYLERLENKGRNLTDSEW